MTRKRLKGNLLSDLPKMSGQEIFSKILEAQNLRIERILSPPGHGPSGWFDQDEAEWVLVLEGFGIIAYEDGSQVTLEKGDHLRIPAHCRHRVETTDPDRPTVWLAVFYS